MKVLRGGIKKPFSCFILNLLGDNSLNIKIQPYKIVINAGVMISNLSLPLHSLSLRINTLHTW